MPFLRLELDAKHNVPKVARAVGSSEAVIGWGLMDLWEWCWRNETDSVSLLVLAGFFGPSDAIPAALTAFGFLERSEDGTYRVRGAAKYLKVTEARRAAGKARAENAKRDFAGQLTSTSPAFAEQTTSKPPALTPNTHSPITKEETSSPEKGDERRAAAEGLVGLWHETKAAEQPRVTKLTKGRISACSDALRRRPTGEWRRVFGIIAQSDYCRGLVNGWVADFDFAIRKEGREPETALKALEGKYDNRGRPSPGRPGELVAGTFAEQVAHLERDENGDLVLT